MDTASITQKGARDYFAMKGHYRPPYEAGTPEYDAYERGWMQSLKRNGGILAGEALQEREDTRRSWTTR